MEHLLALDTRLFASKEGQDNLFNARKTGCNLVQTFVEQRLTSSQKKVFDRIPKNKCEFFSIESQKKQGIDKIKELKEDRELFAKLYLNTQTLNLDRNEFFRYENNPFPPALSVNGRLRGGDKHTPLEKLQKCVPKVDPPGTFSAIIFDGAAVVNYLPHSNCQTFKQYGSEFLGYVTSQAALFNATRVDVPFDQYFEGSTKASTRAARGIGGRRQVLPLATLPSNWHVFLRHSDNKKELFSLLATLLVQLQSTDRKLQVLTNVGDVIRGNAAAVSCLPGTSCAAMEEADGRIILHLVDMIKSGIQDVLIRTVDTDVVVLAISFYHQLKEIGLVSLWVKLGTGTHKKHFPAHAIAEALGNEKAVALRGFHAFTGCDEVSFMASKGKKKAWNTWSSFPEVTKAFSAISNPLKELPVNIFCLLERFTIRLYDAKTTEIDINVVRRDLYDGVKTLALIPTTKESLRQHSLRAAHISGHIWGQAHLSNPCPADPTKWGWKRTGQEVEPLWSTQPDVWEKCQLKKKCHCKKQCTASRCPCRVAGTTCKVECRCRGHCVKPPASMQEEPNLEDPDDPVLDEHGFPVA
ncbi:Phosphoenolpyruvate carboxylase [Frankliniella fusca]|uniref:Phosphoenolpyruvate carboxylase n=1 Tax=Frankliniella fusca TaxID=407009 RepID=A0AAE1GZ67_9NEOP|nr:Phosphoenolpyruvate carboxylase [Frankliniella fusca]